MIIELEELVKNGEIEIKTGPFGTQLKAAEYVESGTPVLNVKNLGYSTVVTTKEDYVGEKTLLCTYLKREILYLEERGLLIVMPT